MPEPSLSPAGWLTFMLGKLDAQAEACRAPTDYYNGVQKLAFATAKYREAFARYFPPLSNNWMKLVVDTPVSRLGIDGFRFDPDPTKPGWDQDADQDARAIWQSNNLDAGSQIAHTEAIKCGVCNVLITPPGEDDDEPLITIEHPSQSYVFCDYANRRKRLAAIKRWVDEIDGYAYAYLYLPEVVHRFRSSKKVRDELITDIQWTRAGGDDPVLNNPIGVVPMVPLENATDLLYGGRSDLEVAIPIQDMVNKLCLDMMLSSEYHAYPQRWAAGWEAVYDADGNQVPGDQVELKVGQSRLIRANSPETTFGTFQTGDVENYIKPIEMYVDHLAAVTQTPAYYLKGKMANLSAEALHAADAGLIDRCRHKILSFSDGWEEVMRVAFLAKSDSKRGKAKSVETLWRNPEVISLAQTVDAAVKMRASLSAPVEFCWELLGWSQQRIMQAKSMMNLPESPAEAARRAAAGGAPIVPRNAPDPASPGGVVLPPSANRSSVPQQR
jgi:hypothetical protein